MVDRNAGCRPRRSSVSSCCLNMYGDTARAAGYAWLIAW